MCIRDRYKGLSEYGKNNLFKRAEILEKLILKFKDKKLFLAKRVLDDFIVYHYPGISVTKLSEEMVKEVIGPIAFVKPGYPFRYSNAWRLAAPADSDPKLFDVYEDGNRAEKVSLPQNSDFVWVFDKYEKVDSVSVSYTHLDVYKRQSLINIVTNVANLTLGSIVPVLPKVNAVIKGRLNQVVLLSLIHI